VVTICLLLGGLARDRAARADVVSAQGRPLAVDVKITALKDGELTYQTGTGQTIVRRIEQIRYLQISGWDGFNQAEKQKRDGQARMAVASFEKLLRNETVSEGQEALDRWLLVRCRLIPLYDAQGQFDKAVTTYLEVIQQMPGAVEAIRPERVPGADPQMLRKAAGLVDKAIAERDRLDPVAISLEKWRAGWPGATDDSSPAPATRPRSSAVRSPRVADTQPSRGGTASSPMVAQVRALVQGGRHEQALERIAAAIKNNPDTFFELCYWQGRAYVGIAGDRKDQAAEARRRAGAAFMRVVVGSPESALAAECLYRAGEVCRDEGRPERAAGLWTELIATYPTAVPWVQQARLELGRVRATATGPAK